MCVRVCVCVCVSECVRMCMCVALVLFLHSLLSSCIVSKACIKCKLSLCAFLLGGDDMCSVCIEHVS